MITDDIIQLQQTTKGPCVTITFPINRNFGSQHQNDTLLKNSVRKAEEMLGKHEGAEIVREKLEGVRLDLSKTHHPDGLALFACPDYIKAIYLPYIPKEEVLVDDFFNLREVLYLQGRMLIYYTMSLTKNGARLFLCEQDILHEIRDDYFPVAFTDDFEYAKHHPVNRPDSYLTGGEEKSTNEERRLINHLHVLDKHLAFYMKEAFPLILVGTEEVVAHFRNDSPWKQKIGDIIYGSYNHAELPVIADLVYPAIRKWQQKAETLVFQWINEAIDKKLFTSGITNIWTSAVLGNCNTLIVEKGYHEKAELDGHVPKINTKDSVNAVLEKVISQGGKVFVVDDGRLAQHQRIGLIQRYVM